MNKMNYLIILLSLFALNCSNDKSSPDPTDDSDLNQVPDGHVTIEYVGSDSDFANPDRGFYRYSATRASNYTFLSEEELKAYRNPTFSQGANYKTISTLIFRYYILDDFVNTSISEAFLDNMQQDFDTARLAGVKLIPRFTYTVSSNEGDCEEGFICPPYGDASKEIILGHILQIGPILTENTDVITCLQLGFIGTWGENYYTDFFGDASPNADQGRLLNKNWEDRIAILRAFLEVTPKDLMIQVRYPQMKQRYVYGINADTDVKALTDSEAFTENDKARIGFHNDCLFASADDYGTYEDYGNSSSPRKTDIQNLKPYFENDSKYVIVGGETCSDGYSPENDCAPTGIADVDLRALHYTYLNANYNNEVNNDWTDGGCIEAIKRNLGYRFTLKNATLPKTIKAGEGFEVKITIENSGYASPVKARNVKLILRSKIDATITSFEFNTDVRFWFDDVNLTETFTPENLTSGEYEVLFHIDDTYETLKGRPEYSIRLSNENIWEASTGYNSLNHIFAVE
jgi:hypothetical protein